MNEFTPTWGRLLAALDAALRGGPGVAARVAALLQPLAPRGLAACRLTYAGRNDLGLSGGAAAKTPDLEERLRKDLERLDPSSTDVMRLTDLESALSLRTQVAAVTGGGRPWGFLLLAHPADAPADRLALAEALLVGTAQTLALNLGCRDELAQLTGPSGLALVGEATLGVAHAIGNHLNTILLQTTIVQMQPEAERKEGLDLIRRKCRQMQALLQPLQHSWQQQRKAVQPLDLNEAARAAVAAEPEAGRVRLELTDDVPRAAATPGGLGRLLRLLLRASLLRQPASAGPVVLRTGARDDKAYLTLEDAGPEVPDVERTDLFDAEGGIFTDADPLERQALQSLLRLFGAALTASPRPGGGLVLTVEWS